MKLCVSTANTYLPDPIPRPMPAHPHLKYALQFLTYLFLLILFFSSALYLLVFICFA